MDEYQQRSRVQVNKLRQHCCWLSRVSLAGLMGRGRATQHQQHLRGPSMCDAVGMACLCISSGKAASRAQHAQSLPATFSTVQVGDATVAFRPEWDRHRLTPRHTAYLRVAEGCSHACTFCAIPGFRQVAVGRLHCGGVGGGPAARGWTRQASSTAQLCRSSTPTSRCPGEPKLRG